MSAKNQKWSGTAKGSNKLPHSYSLKLPHSYRLKMTWIYTRVVLEVRNLEWVYRAAFLLEALRETICFPFPTSTGHPPSLA